MVILFVRMWVEIYSSSTASAVIPSSSSWGCELKYLLELKVLFSVQSSSSWGCELKCNSNSFPKSFLGHPLREDVSWNADTVYKSDMEIMSSSSWGCELKYIRFTYSDVHHGHPLREDVSWNTQQGVRQMRNCSHPLREDVSWNVIIPPDLYHWIVILFVRMWVEMMTL